MQIHTNWYWDQQPKHNVIQLPTRTILHPQLEVNAITDFHAIPTSVVPGHRQNKSSQGSLYV